MEAPRFRIGSAHKLPWNFLPAGSSRLPHRVTLSRSRFRIAPSLLRSCIRARENEVKQKNSIVECNDGTFRGRKLSGRGAGRNNSRIIYWTGLLTALE